MVGGVSEFTLVCTEDLLAFLSLVPIHLALRPQERHLDVDFRPKNCKQKLMRQGLPGGLVAKTPCSQCGGSTFESWSGN